jgi:cysteine desulfurase
MNRIYLDYAATTPTHPEVVQAMLPYFTDVFGNPSTPYVYGQEARKAVEEARNKVASLINAQSEEIVFTSGGTEADNFAIEGVAYANENAGNHIITTSIEHHAVIEPCKFLEKRGFTVTYIPVDKYGLVNPQDVKKAITDKTILISVMHANNEVGTIEPISEIGKIAKERGIIFHTDAVQTVGHIPVDVDELGVDLLSTSAHKLYGPKGIGALYIKKGTRLAPFIHGGQQERRQRAGTENTPAIVGFGKAAEIAAEEMIDEVKRLTFLRDKFITGLLGQVDDLQLNGHPTKRLPNNINVSIDSAKGELMLLNLEAEGIYASAGSACSSSNPEPSPVLLALGLSPEQARSALRFTLGRGTTENSIEQVLEVLPHIIDKAMVMSELLEGLARRSRCC